MLLENIKLKVRKVVEEDKEMLTKDGQTKVKRHIVNIGLVDKDGDPVKLTSFDPAFKLPKVGDDWTLPPVKRFECFDGLIQSLMV